VLTIEEEERSNWSSETGKKQLGLRSSKQKNKKQKQNSSNWSPKQNQFGVQNKICKTNRSSSNWTLVQTLFFFSFFFLQTEDEEKTTEAIVMKQIQLHYGVYVFLSGFCLWWN
jgi:hypothetical protein